jgi:hypothetical protein
LESGKRVEFDEHHFDRDDPVAASPILAINLPILVKSPTSPVGAGKNCRICKRWFLDQQLLHDPGAHTMPEQVKGELWILLLLSQS